MGFDPRRWRPSSGSRPLTTNVEALLAENEALRREVRSLRLQLQVFLGVESEPWSAMGADTRRAPDGVDRAAAAAGPWSAAARRGARPSRSSWTAAAPPGRERVTVASSHGITADLVERWGRSLARHPRWQELRLGPPAGLRGLEEELRRHWWNPALSLEQELDRRSPGLGAELAEALRGPHSRGRWAVRAAFALYGPRAPEWLSEEPQRVVEELLRRLQQLEQRSASGGRRRGTRTANTTGAEPGAGEAPGPERGRSSQAAPGSGPHGEGRQRQHQSSGNPGAGRHSGRQQPSGHGQSQGSRTPGSRRAPSTDPRSQALALLGLEPGASAAAIKRAYRRLAKAHHPDLGGDAEAFRRLDAAYRSLL